MANNYGVANTVFKPFSFEEMLKPALMATEAHNKLEEQISNLEVITNDLEHKITNDPKDKALKEKYNLYKNQLKEASDLLSSKGLNSDIKKTFNNLRALYSQNFGGVDEAYKALLEQNKYISKLAVEHPEILVEGAGTSIYDFMGGKTPELTSLNLNTIINDLAKAGKAEALRNIRFEGWKPDAGGKLLTSVTKTGLSDDEFNTALSEYLNGNPSNNPYATIIGNLYQQGLASNNLKDPNNINKLKNAIELGLRQGFAYDEDIKSLANPGYKDSSDTPSPQEEIDWFSMNNHDVGYLGSEGDVNPEYLELLKKLNNNSAYYGSNSKNPMAIYEEFDKIRGEVPRFDLPEDVIRDGEFTPILWNNKKRKALDVISDKYSHEGITSVLTPKEYEMLKTLGYTSQSDVNSFINYEDMLNNAIKKYTPSRVDNAQWDVFDSTLNSSITNWSDKGISEKYLFEDVDGRKGRGLKPKQASKLKDAKTSNITYDAGNPSVIKIKTDKGTFFMDPSGISAEAKALVEAAEYKINNSTNINEISKTQEQVTVMIRNLLNAYNKVRGKTDSKI